MLLEGSPPPRALKLEQVPVAAQPGSARPGRKAGGMEPGRLKKEEEVVPGHLLCGCLWGESSPGKTSDLKRGSRPTARPAAPRPVTISSWCPGWEAPWAGPWAAGGGGCAQGSRGRWRAVPTELGVLHVAVCPLVSGRPCAPARSRESRADVFSACRPAGGAERC